MEGGTTSSGVGALKSHLGIYIPSPESGSPTPPGGCQLTAPLVHSLTFALPELSHQTNVDIKEMFNKLQ